MADLRIDSHHLRSEVLSPLSPLLGPLPSSSLHLPLACPFVSPLHHSLLLTVDSMVSDLGGVWSPRSSTVLRSRSPPTTPCIDHITRVLDQIGSCKHDYLGELDTVKDDISKERVVLAMKLLTHPNNVHQRVMK
ncbi:hypothetical protein FCM35_KLT20667 [Carex littledalei]|uniref:Uncharacterized protein n=1 Tax=Carex littledalei TaxID=544730 RepID=A0A833R088_9POAL|nr:hypothetical protein FCM35_KLT20667 [Carex littledalei]